MHMYVGEDHDNAIPTYARISFADASSRHKWTISTAPLMQKSSIMYICLQDEKSIAIEYTKDFVDNRGSDAKSELCSRIAVDFLEAVAGRDSGTCQSRSECGELRTRYSCAGWATPVSRMPLSIWTARLKSSPGNA